VIRLIVVSWVLNAVVLAVTTWLLGGVTNDGSGWTLIWAAAVFGVLNTILKPIMRLITLPFAMVTFGLAWFFVSMLMLWLTTLAIDDFNVDGFWNYVWATIIIWAVNAVIDIIQFRAQQAETRSAATA